MQIITSVKIMQERAREARSAGRTIAFVPTMGFLHEGHASLLREGRRRGDVLVLSIFVNPTQFGAGEDFDAYPRNLERDAAMAEEAGADFIFAPDAREMYPNGYQTYVDVHNLTLPLCGAWRPGHFRGVTTVVAKLFNIVAPHTAFFGEKDYQQLKIIQRMVKDLNLEVEVIGFPIVRDENGLALSSRNAYLSPSEKERASLVSRALREIKKEFDMGCRNTKIMVELGKKTLKEAGINQIDYLEICDSKTLQSKEVAECGDLVAVAVRLSEARLIDNIRL